MIPLGTGIFKTLYDTNKHNEIIKKLQESKEKKLGSKVCETGFYSSRGNIVEEKLLKSVNNLDKSEILEKLNFNLIDLIN